MREGRLSAVLFSVILVALAPLAWTQSQTPDKPAFQIVTQNLPVPIPGQRYVAPLKVIGGQPPYHWSIQNTPLPAGLTLDPDTGIIRGRPQLDQTFSVVVQVADSSQPPLIITKLLVAGSTAPIKVEWVGIPAVVQSNIVGAVRASNGSKDTVETTVIVVAVNEVGKAFALRYEKLNLAPGSESPDLKFDVFVPSGSYTLHVDAVGEVAAKNAIYRDRLELNGLAVQ